MQERKSTAMLELITGPNNCSHLHTLHKICLFNCYERKRVMNEEMWEKQNINPDQDSNLKLCKGPSMWSKPSSLVLSELQEDGDSDLVSLSSRGPSTLPWISSSEFSSDTEPTMKWDCKDPTAGFFLAAPSCSAMAGQREQAANTDSGTRSRGRSGYKGKPEVIIHHIKLEHSSVC